MLQTILTRVHNTSIILFYNKHTLNKRAKNKYTTSIFKIKIMLVVLLPAEEEKYFYKARYFQKNNKKK